MTFKDITSASHWRWSKSSKSYGAPRFPTL